MTFDRDSVVLGVSCALALFIGFTLGAAYERQGEEEWHRMAECPEKTWKMSTCVPDGCSWDLKKHEYDCKDVAP